MNDTQERSAGFRNKRTAPFTMLANAMLRNASLSLKAKGLLAVMLSFPDDWQYHMRHIEGQSSDGRDSHRAALKELADFGYVVMRRAKDERGRHARVEYEVSDVGWENPQYVKPSTIGFSGAGKPGAGEPDTTNTDLTKTDLDQEKDGAAPHRARPTPRAPDDPAHLPPVRESGQAERKAGNPSPPTALEKVPRGAAVEFPPELAAHSGWEEAWGEWLAYRRERKLTCTPATLKKQLHKLATMPDPLAVMEQSITQGWAGLFPLKGAGKPRTQADANQRFVENVQAHGDAIRGIFDD